VPKRDPAASAMSAETGMVVFMVAIRLGLAVCWD
jgi:hypothetical protein